MKIKLFSISFTFLFILSGCGISNTHTGQKKAVDNMISHQLDAITTVYIDTVFDEAYGFNYGESIESIQKKLTEKGAEYSWGDECHLEIGQIDFANAHPECILLFDDENLLDRVYMVFQDDEIEYDALILCFNEMYGVSIDGHQSSWLTSDKYIELQRPEEGSTIAVFESLNDAPDYH